MSIQQSKQSQMTQEMQHLTPNQKLRSKLQVGEAVTIDELTQCFERDSISTCEELLAFQKYDLFEKLRNKKQISDAELFDHSETRELYQGYLVARKGMTSAFAKKGYKEITNKQFNLKNLQEQKNRQRKNKLIKLAFFGVLLILCSVSIYKYREYIIKILKLIVNIK